MSKRKSSRRVARERAFHVLYGLTFAPAVDDWSLRRAFDEWPGALPDEDLPPADQMDELAEEFSWDLVSGVWGNLVGLDEVIGRFSQNWKLARIGRIELTILRLSVYEMLHRADIPLKVAINEAVELSKEYGDDNSQGFVNGILDAAARAVDSGQFGVHKGMGI